MKQKTAAIAICIAALLIGTLTVRLFRLRRMPSMALLSGTISIFGLFFLIAYPMRAFGGSFAQLTAVFSSLMCAALAVSVFFLFWKGEYKKYYEGAVEVFRHKTALKLVTAAVIVFVCVLGFSLTLRSHPSSDDSFYFPKAMEIIETDSLSQRDSVVWYGWLDETVNDTSDASTFEILRAYLSQLTGVPVTAVCKGALACLLKLVSIAAYWQFFISFFRRDDTKLKPLLALLALNALWLIEQNVVGSTPYWNLRYIWMGKAVLSSIVFPCIFMICAEIYYSDGKIIWTDWLFLLTTICAALCVSVMGTNFTVLYCVVLAAPLIIYRLVKRRTIRQYFAPAAVAMLPAIIVALVTLLTTISSYGYYFTDFSVPSWMGAFHNLFDYDKGLSLFLYAVSTVFFALKGNTEQRLLIAGSAAVLFATFLNPLLTELVSRYLTTGPIYWRLYWLLPYWTAIAAAAAEILTRYGKKYAEPILYGVYGALACVAAAVFVFTGKGNTNSLIVNYAVSARANEYALDDVTLEAADIILEDHSGEERPMLLCRAVGGMRFIRQYSVDIGLCIPIRESEIAKRSDVIPGTETSVEDFYQAVFNTGISDTELLRDGLEYLDADYLFIYGSEDQMPSCNFLTLLWTCQEGTLWRVEPDGGE